MIFLPIAFTNPNNSMHEYILQKRGKLRQRKRINNQKKQNEVNNFRKRG